MQGHRYNIVEGWGCYATTYNTWVAIVLVSIWPMAITLVSIVYGSMSLRYFLQHRQEFDQFLGSTPNSDFTVRRYLRLMWFSGTQVSSITLSVSYRAASNILMFRSGPFRFISACSVQHSSSTYQSNPIPLDLMGRHSMS